MVKAQMVSAFSKRKIAFPFRLISGTARAITRSVYSFPLSVIFFMRAANCHSVKCRLEAIILVGFKVRKAVIFQVGTQIPALAVFAVVSVHASCKR